MWQRLRRLGVYTVLGLAAGKGLDGVVVHAQSPPPNGMPRTQTVFTNKTQFKLPVDVPAADRANLREIKLYAKVGNGDWTQQEFEKPSVREFLYQARQEGTYAFHLVTIDRTGKVNPPDLNRTPPALQVIVDTQPPSLDFVPWIAPDGEMCIRCSMNDAHPDLASLRLHYRGLDGLDHQLEPMAERPGVFRIPMEVYGRPVTLSGSDRCRNIMSKEFTLPAPTVANTVHTPQPAPTREPGLAALEPAPPKMNAAVPDVGPSSAGKDPALVNTAYQPDPPLNTRVESPAPPRLESMAPSRPEAALPAPVVHNPPMPPVPPAPTVIAPPPPPGPLPSTLTTTPTAGPLPANAEALPVAAGRQMLSTPKVSLNYRIDQVGASNVGKVELFVTTDRGASWQRLGEDGDKNSPAEFNLPGEGEFGLRLVVTNGNGFGGTPPARGEQPTAVVEVDTTCPFVHLQEVEPTARDGCLDIRWKASDKNLGTEPVSLFYRSRPDAPWAPIVRNIKNDGLYRWSFPRDHGSQFFVKIEVADQAGNVARIEQAQPVVLDMTEPRASIVGITGIRAVP